MGDDIELLGILVQAFYIDIRGDKVVLHHQYGVDNLTSAGHPALMSGHGLGGAHRRLAAKYLMNGFSLIGIPYGGGGGMCIDIVYLGGLHGGIGQCACHRLSRAFHIGGGYVSAIGGEAIAYYFGKDGCSTALRALVGFQYECCCSPTGHQAITRGIEGARGLLRGILAHGEYT